MQVEHLKRQLKDKETTALHTTRRNKLVGTQRRNSLVNELRRINDHLGKGSLPYHDTQFYETRKKDLLKQLESNLLLIIYIEYMQPEFVQGFFLKKDLYLMKLLIILKPNSRC